jgi:hypothetical protein
VGIETLAAASIVGSIGGGVLGAFGADRKADAEQEAYGYKAQVARNNAIIAERNAQAAIESGDVAGQVSGLKTKNLVAQQLVVQAGSGLDVNTGSAVDVRQSAADLGRLDTLTIINNALKQSKGYKAQAGNFLAEADLNESAGRYAREAGDIGIMTSLLGGATSVGDKWAGFRSKGVF